jgi:hypothetical protein
MTDATRPWPPLIVADHAPRLIWWRDFSLTILMWTVFVIMLDAELKLFFHRLMNRWGFGDLATPANWLLYFERLTPFFLVVLVLVSLLVLAAILTARQRRRALLLPMPLPLALAEQSRRAGMDEAALTAARALPVAVVHLDPDGKFRIATV